MSQRSEDKKYVESVNSVGAASFSDSSSHDKEAAIVEEGAPDRAAWGGQIEFILTCVGYAVGLGNVWRFPYLCYKNGGGAFLIPYIFMLVFVGLPLFYLELSLGQFTSLGPLGVWKFNPLWKGLGYASVIVSYIVSIYYNVIIAICAYYLFVSMARELPWQTCDNEWNTFKCVTLDELKNQATSRLSATVANVTSNATTAIAATTTTAISAATSTANYTFCKDLVKQLNLSDDAYLGDLDCYNRTTPSEEYFYNTVLNLTPGMNEPGGMRWELAGCLLFCWVIVCVVLIRGISSLGKVVYFTALFPYVLLTVLLIRGVTLDGAVDGIKYYLTPEWSKLLRAQVWSDAAVQIFYSLSVASGGLMAMASYNKFNNNNLRDSLIVPVINCATSVYAGFVIFSVLGYMANLKQTTVDKVADQGPGLTFVVYPEALSTMPLPPLWSILFFIMMMTLGFSSQFSMVETVLTAFLDEFPSFKKSKRHETCYRIGLCVLGFLLGLPMCFDGGFYLLNLVDNYCGGFPLIIVGIGELVSVSWIYGYNNFADDVTLMVGKPPPLFLKAMLMVISPVLMIVCMIFTAIQYEPLSFRGYAYTSNYSAIGWLTMLFCVGFIPFFAIRKLYQKGLLDVLKAASRPSPKWGPAHATDRAGTKYERIAQNHAADMCMSQQTTQSHNCYTMSEMTIPSYNTVMAASGADTES